MTFSTRKEAADKLRDLYQDPHPRKFREIFTADSIPRLIELLDPPLVDDPVRDKAVAMLTMLEKPMGAAILAHKIGDGSPFTVAVEDLRGALAFSPPSLAHELHLTRQAMATQGAQLFRLGVALQLARIFAFTAVKFAESEVVRPFLRDWFDQGDFVPLAWPDAGKLPVVAKILLDKGYANIDGAIGMWLTSNRVDPELGRDFVR